MKIKNTVRDQICTRESAYRVSSISKINFLGFWSTIDFLIELKVEFFYVRYVKVLDWN